MKKTLQWVIAFTIMLSFSGLMAQNKPNQTANNSNQIIDLGETEVKIKVETPNVQIYSKRIKPEFDDIKIDRSFHKELIGEDEKINLKPRSESTEYIRIDIGQLMKKLR